MHILHRYKVTHFYKTDFRLGDKLADGALLLSSMVFWKTLRNDINPDSRYLLLPPKLSHDA